MKNPTKIRIHVSVGEETSSYLAKTIAHEDQSIVFHLNSFAEAGPEIMSMFNTAMSRVQVMCAMEDGRRESKPAK